MANPILAYNVKTKQKEEMKKAVIDRSGKRCFAKGESAGGQKLCVAIGLSNAEAAIKSGVATKGSGW
jgi:hypothetical protein